MAVAAHTETILPEDDVAGTGTGAGEMPGGVGDEKDTEQEASDLESEDDGDETKGQPGKEQGGTDAGDLPPGGKDAADGTEDLADDGNKGDDMGDTGEDGEMAENGEGDKEAIEPVHSIDLAESGVHRALPSFVVNDDSRIDITVSSHEFETSMARNDFSKSSTEGSISGGYAGFSVSATYGRSSAASKTNTETTNDYKKTMIAKYLLPRADVFLNPEDLEPTPQLLEALETIRTQRRIQDLCKLQKEFGHVFCRKAPIGGRLMATKIMTAEGKGKEQEEKQQFKTSFGLQVNTPINVSAGVQHSKETGTPASSGKNQIKKSEQNVFEAVGGNTILASNPLAWAATVAHPNNWRTISRDNVTAMADFISLLSGWSNVKNDFIQSVAKLSAYYEVGASREVHVRLSLTAPTTQLSMSYVTRQSKAQTKPNYYLGHAAGSFVEPRYLTKAYPHAFWGDLVEHPSDPPLFLPKRYNAPVIIGCLDVDDAAVTKGVLVKSTVWKITVPFHEALQHGSRVIISTMPDSKKMDLPHGESKETPIPASSMIVFRNQQGVFLPGMSNSEEVQYWRILKKGGNYLGEHIKEGDNIRLCWNFADQTSGFRDFSDDVFGRRRKHKPPELQVETLYLKLPWPRFEPLAKSKSDDPIPNSMIMSPHAEEGQAFLNVPTIPAMNRYASGTDQYVVQDVCFRIDPVSNEGAGEHDDYLLESSSGQSNVADGMSAISKLSYNALFV